MMFHMEYLNNFMMLSSSIMLSFLLVPVLVLFVGFCIYCQYNRHDYSDRGHHFPVEKCGTDQARCSPIMQQGTESKFISEFKKMIWEARTKWYDIGVELQLPIDDLECIRKMNSDPGDCLTDMLKKWYQQRKYDRTQFVTNLINVLRSKSIGFDRLAADLLSQQQQLSSQGFDETVNEVPDEQQVKHRSNLISSELFQGHVAIEISFHNQHSQTDLQVTETSAKHSNIHMVFPNMEESQSSTTVTEQQKASALWEPSLPMLQPLQPCSSHSLMAPDPDVLKASSGEKLSLEEGAKTEALPRHSCDDQQIQASPSLSIVSVEVQSESESNRKEANHLTTNGKGSVSTSQPAYTSVLNSEKEEFGIQSQPSTTVTEQQKASTLREPSLPMLQPLQPCSSHSIASDPDVLKASSGEKLSLEEEIDALPQQIQANLSLNSSLPIVSVEVQSESESDKKEEHRATNGEEILSASQPAYTSVVLNSEEEYSIQSQPLITVTEQQKESYLREPSLPMPAANCTSGHALVGQVQPCSSHCLMASDPEASSHKRRSVHFKTDLEEEIQLQHPCDSQLDSQDYLAVSEIHSESNQEENQPQNVPNSRAINTMLASDSKFTKSSQEMSADAKKRYKDIKKVMDCSKQVDVCFVFGHSGFFRCWRDHVKRNIRAWCDRLTKNFSKINLRVAFVFYTKYNRHHCCQSTPFTSDLERVQKFLDSITVDTEDEDKSMQEDKIYEDVVSGLQTAVKFHWTKGGTNVLIHIANAPCIKEEYLRCNVSPTGVDPERLSLNAVLGKLARREILYHFGHNNKAITSEMVDEFNKLLMTQSHATTLIQSFDADDSSGIDEAVYRLIVHCMEGTVLTGQSKEFCLLRTISTIPNWDELEPQQVKVICSQNDDNRSRNLAQHKWIKIARNPFARGNTRHAFHAQDTDSNEHLVLKEFMRKEGRYSCFKRFLEVVQLHADASRYALQFNKRKPPGTLTLKFIPVGIMEYVSNDENIRYYTYEPYISGQYEKFNNNGIFVSPEEAPVNNICQAFSHFTFDESKRSLVCNIEGVKISDNQVLLSDPAIHDPNLLVYGPTNLGDEGIKHFRGMHVCNDICHYMKLKSLQL